MNKIDLSNVHYIGGIWGFNSPARNSWTWLCEKTGHDRWLSNSKTQYYMVDDHHISFCKSFDDARDYGNQNGATQYGVVTFEKGTGWSIVTYHTMALRIGFAKPRKSDVHVLIEDDLLAVEFKLLAPWETCENWQE